MKTPLFILLQATGGIRNEVNTFLSDYAVPVIAMLLIVGVGIGVVMNYDKIIGEFYQFNLSSCIRQQNSLTAQFVSFSLSNLANIFYPPPIFTIINLCLL